jgi:putative ATP-dependent endonuclease of the OLD family
MGNEDAVTQVLNSPDSTYGRLKSALNHIDFRLTNKKYIRHSKQVILEIRDSQDRELLERDLSAGQRSIIHTLSIISGYNLRNGVLVIDEPELHLHVSLQKKYFELLKEFSRTFNLQLIIVTHSPVFIDQTTIDKTIRFFKNGSTEIVQPKSITGNAQELLPVLQYSNSGRVFFADKVVLVEGVTDEYFLNFFLDNVFRKTGLSKENIEIVSIGGKKNFNTWRQLLGSFKIKNYYVCDFDNVIDFQLLTKSDYDGLSISIVSKLKSSLSDKNSKDAKELLMLLDTYIENPETRNLDDLKELWMYLKKRSLSAKEIVAEFRSSQNDKYNALLNAITEKKSEGIYILTKGDLEAYIGKAKGNLQRTIDFCTNNFEKWQEQENDEFKEVYGILESIIKA